jgi:parallel beta-helix repeat protein
MNNKVMIASLAVICSVLICGAAIYTTLRLQDMSPSFQRTIVVPDDFPTISDAIGNATEGVTIYVKKGTYEILNDVLVINKTLSIIGEDAVDTVLSASGVAYGTLQTKNEAKKAGYTLLGTEISPSNGIILPKVAIRVYADNFKISNLTINNCDIGISVIGNGTEISNTIMAGVSVSGFYSKIFDNNITDASAGHNSFLSTFTMSGFCNTIFHNSIANIVHSECSMSFSNITENAVQGDINFKGSSNMIMSNSFRSMTLTSSDSNIIKNNTFSHLCLYSSSNNTFFGNTARGPGYTHGILLSSGSSNVFYGNYIADYNGISTFTGRHYGYAVDIGSMAENNLFYHNNFVNNYVNLMYSWNPEMSNNNYWENEKEGNYWSDYNGVDANGDGIGDAPYTIYYKNVDHYPLMAPFNIEGVNAELSEGVNASGVGMQDFNLSQPFPMNSATISSEATAIATSFGLIVYFKKRNRRRNP